MIHDIEETEKEKERERIKGERRTLTRTGANPRFASRAAALLSRVTIATVWSVGSTAGETALTARRTTTSGLRASEREREMIAE